MKYCIKYEPKLKISYAEADEIILPYDQNNRNIVNFLEKYQEKTIIFDLKEECDIKLLKAFIDKYPNLKIRLTQNLIKTNAEFFEKIFELKMPFFFEDHAYSWDTLYNLLYYSPTDIYITQELGFELDKIAKILHERGIQVRVFPNVAQAGGKNIDAIKTFFIRPEDIQYYEPFVDVCELYGHDRKAATYLKIYKKDQKWFGQLGEIIIGYKGILDSRFIIPIFAQARVKCGKKCLKGRKCHICERIEEAAETLKDNNLLIKHNKV